MEQNNSHEMLFNDLLLVMNNDKRIRTIHVTLLFIFYILWLKNKSQSPAIRISRKSIMKLSKIKSFSTYHKALSDLHQFGFLHYYPSFHPAIKSKIQLDFVDSSKQKKACLSSML